MTKIEIDAQTAQTLRDAGEHIELSDPEGRIVGYFYPPASAELYRTVKEPFTSEELERFRNEPGGRSLEEIMRDLQGKA